MREKAMEHDLAAASTQPRYRYLWTRTKPHKALLFMNKGFQSC